MLSQNFLIIVRKCAVSALLSLAAAVPAFAETVSVKYSGTVSEVLFATCISKENGYCNAWSFAYPQSLVLEGKSMASEGEQFNGGFSYHLNSQAWMSEDGYQASYLYSTFDSHFQAGSISANSDDSKPFGGSSAVVNDRAYEGTDGPFGGHDAFAAYSSSNEEDWYTSSNWVAMFDIFLHDSTARVFDSFELPTQLDFANFQYASASFVFLNTVTGDQLRLRGNIQSLETENTNNVPEPTTCALVLLGLAFTAGMTRRGRRHIHL